MIGVLLLLAGVSDADAKKPKFKDEKVFVPLDTPEFIECNLRLEQSKNACEAEANKDARSCQAAASMELASCQIQSDNTYKQCQASGQAYCAKPICSAKNCLPKLAPCEAAFETGYVGCGGQVRTEQVCVKNCVENGGD